MNEAYDHWRDDQDRMWNDDGPQFADPDTEDIDRREDEGEYDDPLEDVHGYSRSDLLFGGNW